MASSISVYQATLAGRREVYNAYLAAGKGTPFLYPWDTLPALYLFLGIIIRPHLSPPVARASGYVAFAAVVVHSAYVCLYRRTIGFAGGYGIGLACAWGMIMTGVLLLLHEPEKDFVRLEIREAAAAATYIRATEGVSYAVDKTEISKEIKSRQAGKSKEIFVPAKSMKKQTGPTYRLIWQPFPTEVLHCIDWTIDLMTSFRGPNWNFRIPTLPKIQTLPPPPQCKTTKAIEATMLANETENPSDPTSTSLHLKCIKDSTILYLLLDLTKTILITDPYFLGLRPLTSTSPWPILRDLPFLTKLVRMLIALSSVITALSFIFSLGPLFFYTILSHLIPQQTLLKITKSPLYDPRMYTPQFSHLLTNITTHGLSGFWGKSWHQMFRYGISEPSIPLVKALKLNPRSQAGRAIQLLVAFTLTGSIHALASYTTFSIINSRPQDPWLFFMSQAVGIILQTALADLFVKQMKLKSPKIVRQAANTTVVVVWLWITGPWLADDFARAGVWLFEPLPISFFRGVTGHGWWHWSERWAGVWNGNGAFESGLAAY